MARLYVDQDQDKGNGKGKGKADPSTSEPFLDDDGEPVEEDFDCILA